MSALAPRTSHLLHRHICTSCRRQLLLQPSTRSHDQSLRSKPVTRQQRFSTTSLRASPSSTSPSSAQLRPASSVSQDEVSHFDALAASWWDPYGPSRLLHLMNPLRHSFLQRCRSQHPRVSTATPSPPAATQDLNAGDASQGLTYLDIGCGGGIFAESAARLPDTASVTAIDPSSEVLAVAQAHARQDPLLNEALGSGVGSKRRKLTYLNTAIEDLGEHLRAGQAQGQHERHQFDVVSLFEVIEHVPYPSIFLREVLPYVKPGGWLVGSTISRTLASWFTTKLIAEDLVGLVPRGTHDWDKYINPDELRNFFGKLNEESDIQLGRWGNMVVQEVVYVPALGWKEVKGFEGVGNYFFAVRRET